MVVCDGLPPLPPSTLTHGVDTTLVNELQNVVVAELAVLTTSHPVLVVLTVLRNPKILLASEIFWLLQTTGCPAPVSPADVLLEVANALPSKSAEETALYLRSQ